MSEPRNPLMKRALKKGLQSPAYHRSWKQEKEGAKRLKGFTTPGSGSKSTKGDVTVRNMARVEYKCTSNKSFAVTREMLGKIKNAAIASNQVPYIEVEFLGAYGKTLSKIAVIQTDELEILLNRMRDAEAQVEALKSQVVAEKRNSGRVECDDDGRPPERQQKALPHPRKQRDPVEGSATVLRSVPRLVVPRPKTQSRW